MSSAGAKSSAKSKGNTQNGGPPEKKGGVLHAYFNRVGSQAQPSPPEPGPPEEAKPSADALPGESNAGSDNRGAATALDLSQTPTPAAPQNFFSLFSKTKSSRAVVSPESQVVEMCHSPPPTEASPSPAPASVGAAQEPVLVVDLSHDSPRSLGSNQMDSCSDPVAPCAQSPEEGTAESSLPASAEAAELAADDNGCRRSSRLRNKPTITYSLPKSPPRRRSEDLLPCRPAKDASAPANVAPSSAGKEDIQEIKRQKKVQTAELFLSKADKLKLEELAREQRIAEAMLRTRKENNLMLNHSAATAAAGVNSTASSSSSSSGPAADMVVNSFFARRTSTTDSKRSGAGSSGDGGDERVAGELEEVYKALPPVSLGHSSHPFIPCGATRTPCQRDTRSSSALADWSANELEGYDVVVVDDGDETGYLVPEASSRIPTGVYDWAIDLRGLYTSFLSNCTLASPPAVNESIHIDLTGAGSSSATSGGQSGGVGSEYARQRSELIKWLGSHTGRGPSSQLTSSFLTEGEEGGGTQETEKEEDGLDEEDIGHPSRASSQRDQPIPLGVLHGPMGSGKTALVYDSCRAAGVSVLEVNTSHLRTTAYIKKLVADITEGTLHGPTALLLDDADAVCSEEESHLHSCIKQLVAWSRCPLVLTVTQLPAFLHPTSKVSFSYLYWATQRPPSAELASWLAEKANSACPLSPPTSSHDASRRGKDGAEQLLADVTDADVRACQQQLALYPSGWPCPAQTKEMTRFRFLDWLRSKSVDFACLDNLLVQATKGQLCHGGEIALPNRWLRPVLESVHPHHLPAISEDGTIIRLCGRHFLQASWPQQGLCSVVVHLSPLSSAAPYTNQTLPCALQQDDEVLVRLPPGLSSGLYSVIVEVRGIHKLALRSDPAWILISPATSMNHYLAPFSRTYTSRRLAAATATTEAIPAGPRKCAGYANTAQCKSRLALQRKRFRACVAQRTENENVDDGEGKEMPEEREEDMEVGEGEGTRDANRRSRLRAALASDSEGESEAEETADISREEEDDEADEEQQECPEGDREEASTADKNEEGAGPGGEQASHAQEDPRQAETESTSGSSFESLLSTLEHVHNQRTSSNPLSPHRISPEIDSLEVFLDHLSAADCWPGAQPWSREEEDEEESRASLTANLPHTFSCSQVFKARSLHAAFVETLQGSIHFSTNEVDIQGDNRPVDYIQSVQDQLKIQSTLCEQHAALTGLSVRKLPLTASIDLFPMLAVLSRSAALAEIRERAESKAGRRRPQRVSEERRYEYLTSRIPLREMDLDALLAIYRDQTTSSALATSWIP